MADDASIAAAVDGVPSSSSRPSSDGSRYESGSSLRSLVYLVAHQLLTRIGTFVLNIMVARHIGPVAYGISAVHLYLLNTMVLFLCREAIRRSHETRLTGLCAPQGHQYSRST